MNQLASRAIGMKHFNRGKEQKWASKGQGLHLVPFVDTDEYDASTIPKKAEIMANEIVKGKPYYSSVLKVAKTKKSTTVSGKFKYAFDISKAKQIFDYLLKDHQIRLMDGHKIPSANEIKDKKYCKWHNSYSHNTANCLVFQ